MSDASEIVVRAADLIVEQTAVPTEEDRQIKLAFEVMRDAFSERPMTPEEAACFRKALEQPIPKMQVEELPLY